MNSIISIEEKELSQDGYSSNLSSYFKSYVEHFAVYQNNVSEQGYCYMLGLISSNKGEGNMERIEESQKILPYHQYQHFLTNSTWSADAVIEQVAKDASALMQKEKEKQGYRVGLILDESGHIKQGMNSVGVARQYIGQLGKVDNCQIGVYSTLVCGTRPTLIGERLFLPSCWAEDTNRCVKAGIPPKQQEHQTKPILALQLVDEALAWNVKFDWVGGDGLYGHSYELGAGLDQRNLLFVLDVHKDQQVYLSAPIIAIPSKKAGRGRPPSTYKTTSEPKRVDTYLSDLEADDWKKITIRQTTKEDLCAWVHCKQVWVWNGLEAKARERTLIIRRTIGRDGVTVTDTKFSLSNGKLSTYSAKEFAYFQAQRYWIERNFEDAKNEVGLSDYQVRKWTGWHHHHAVVMMAMLFLLREQIDKEADYPSMSLTDARKIITILIEQCLFPIKNPIQTELQNMEKRHDKRKKATQWYRKNSLFPES